MLLPAAGRNERERARTLRHCVGKCKEMPANANWTEKNSKVRKYRSDSCLAQCTMTFTKPFVVAREQKNCRAREKLWFARRYIYVYNVRAAVNKRAFHMVNFSDDLEDCNDNEPLPYHFPHCSSFFLPLSLSLSFHLFNGFDKSIRGNLDDISRLMLFFSSNQLITIGLKTAVQWLHLLEAKTTIFSRTVLPTFGRFSLESSKIQKFEQKCGNYRAHYARLDSKELWTIPWLYTNWKHIHVFQFRFGCDIKFFAWFRIDGCEHFDCSNNRFPIRDDILLSHMQRIFTPAVLTRLDSTACEKNMRILLIAAVNDNPYYTDSCNSRRNLSIICSILILPVSSYYKRANILRSDIFACLLLANACACDANIPGPVYISVNLISETYKHSLQRAATRNKILLAEFRNVYWRCVAMATEKSTGYTYVLASVVLTGRANFSQVAGVVQ